VPAYPGRPGKDAIKRVSVCLSVLASSERSHKISHRYLQ